MRSGLGVLLEKGTNLPVQYVEGTFTGLDLTTEEDYKAIVSNTEELVGTGIALAPIVKEEVGGSLEPSDTEAPTGGDFNMDATTNSTSVELTITCPLEDTEMYISGNITDGSAWETCVISKNVTLTTGYESKSISMKWKDTEGNETSIITKNIDFSLCSYDECLSDGYYVIASGNSTYPQGCKTSGLTNVETHCVLKLGTLYIAPSSTEGNNIEFINASAICTNGTWGGLTWRLPNDAQAGNELNTMYDNRALLYDDSRSTDCYWDDDQDLGCFRTTYDVYPDWTAPRQVRCVRSS